MSNPIVVTGVSQGTRLTPANNGTQYAADEVVTEIGGLTITRNVLIAGGICLVLGMVAKA